jgi:hypothetical protein
MRKAQADDYDFLCGNDFSLVKIALNNDDYHTVRIQADLAKTINFSGGIKNLDEVIIDRCFKFTRIFWPEYAGSIKRLKIGNSPELVQLDLSTLKNLEELCIVNCVKLKEITGLSEKIRFLNVQGCSLELLDLSACKKIETFILTTTSTHLKLDLDHCHSLTSIVVNIEKDASFKEDSIQEQEDGRLV